MDYPKGPHHPDHQLGWVDDGKEEFHHLQQGEPTQFVHQSFPTVHPDLPGIA